MLQTTVPFPVHQLHAADGGAQGESRTAGPSFHTLARTASRLAAAAVAPFFLIEILICLCSHHRVRDLILSPFASAASWSGKMKEEVMLQFD